MAERERDERIELVVEQLSFTAPEPVDHLRVARRVWTATQRTAQAAAADRAQSAASAPSGGAVTTVIRTATFRRLIDLPGASLETVLDAWWSRSPHDDGHLRLDQLTCDRGLFALAGSLRTSPLSRRIPVEVRLSGYLSCWSFLELVPQRPTHATRWYFHVGHDSLDRFVAAVCALR